LFNLKKIYYNNSENDNDITIEEGINNTFEKNNDLNKKYYKLNDNQKLVLNWCLSGIEQYDGFIFIIFQVHQ
jgi:hypothetical protein